MPILSASTIAGYAKNAGVTGGNVSIATAIALAESGGNTDIQSPPNTDGSVDLGVWQINNKAHRDLLNGKDWRDPAQNAAMMFSVSNGGTNWRPWSVYTSGAYLKYLSQANAVVPDTSVTGTPASNSFGDSLTAIQKFAQVISDPHNWLRVGMVVGGSVLILLAVHKSVDTHIPGVAKLAAKAAFL